MIRKGNYGEREWQSRVERRETGEGHREDKYDQSTAEAGVCSQSMYVCTEACMCTQGHVYVHRVMFVCTEACICAQRYVCVQRHVCVQKHACVLRAYMCAQSIYVCRAYMCAQRHVCVNICMHLYSVYIYMQVSL